VAAVALGQSTTSSHVNALPTKVASKSTKKRFSEEFLDSYFVPTWIWDKQFLALFNYNDSSDFEKECE
jgi:hypothetical protein